MKTISPWELPIEDFIDLCQLIGIKPNMKNPFPGRDHFLAWLNKKSKRVEIALNSIKTVGFNDQLKSLLLEWYKELPTLAELLG